MTFRKRFWFFGDESRSSMDLRLPVLSAGRETPSRWSTLQLLKTSLFSDVDALRPARACGLGVDIDLSGAWQVDAEWQNAKWLGFYRFSPCAVFVFITAVGTRKKNIKGLE